jgi:hypothetical protein
MTKECFVIMPFSETTKEHTKEYWDCFFKEFIKPALCEHGYKARRSTATPENIIKGIIQDLQSSNLVLAILTDCNPNVWYELGVRHSLRKGTVMIIEEDQEIPFDLRPYGVVFYSDKDRDYKKLANKLKDHIEQAETGKPDNPVADFLDPYAGLIFTINRAESRLRQAINMISRLRKEERCTEQQLLKSIEDLQKSWGDQEEVCVVECESRRYEIKFHRDCNHIGRNPNNVWRIATEYMNINGEKLKQIERIEPTLPERIPGRQSLFEEIEGSTKGLRVVHLLGWGSRTTVFAYERITQPDWMIIVEAHWRP